MPVFISHKDSDSVPAVSISRFLTSRGVTNYVDVLDKSTQSTNDITDLITRRIGECTHLIAVMSTETSKSWWVPFEVGEATFGLRRISSYDLGVGYQFPDYLRKWPVMKKEKDLELFVQAYKSDGSSPSVLNEALRDSTRRRTYNPDEFHRQLKANIQRGW